MSRLLRILTTSVLVVVGCGDGEEVDNSIVQAVSTENKTVKAREELQVAAAAAAKAKREAQDAEQAALDAAIDAAAVQPAEAPTDLETACESVVEAYDAFMKSGAEEDALRWSDGRRHKLGERRSACLKVGNLQIAACEAQALTTAPAEIAELPRKDAGRLLMERCHDKFGST